MSVKATFVSRLWNGYSHVYDGLLHFWPYKNLIQLLFNEAHIETGNSVLELGCGTGNILSLALEVADTKLTGVDMSPSMLHQAGSKLHDYVAAGRLNLKQDDVLAFLRVQPSGSFDRIISCNVLYAIDDQITLWQELMRVIAPNGRIAITTSVRVGSGPIIREHLANSSFWQLFRPRLLGVFIIDSLINLLGSSGHFSFSDENKLHEAIISAGGHPGEFRRCYGGSRDGVNVLFSVHPNAV